MTNRAQLTTRARVFPALLLLTAACTVAAPTASPSADTAAPPPAPITIGSGSSVELQLMSELYAQALEAAGYEVLREAPAADGGTLLALMADGAVDLSASVVSELAAAGGADPNADLDDLRAHFADDGLTFMEPTGAARALGVSMRLEDADEANIATISELVASGGEIAWGLPADCAAVAECAAMIGAYGLSLEQMTVVEVPMCAAESGTALNDRTADATLVCTTQPELERLNLVVLEDDLQVLPPGTIAPVVRTEWLNSAPAEFGAVIASVSETIDTGTLTSLGVQVTVEERGIADVAREWLEDNGLI